MDRRSLIKVGLAAGASTAAAIDWMLPDWRTAMAAPVVPGVRKVGADDADRLWAQARALLAADNARGGRVVAPQALALLNDTAMPMLAGRFANDEAANKVIGAVAYSGHLAGWCSTDTGDIASAQALMTRSLKLAKRAGDAKAAAGILTDLAHLEHLVGEPADGVRLAQAAQTPGPSVLPAALLARAAAMEARNAAKLGDTLGTNAAIKRARGYMERQQAAGGPHPLDFFFDEVQLETELHVAFRDLAIARAAKPETVFRHAAMITGRAPHMGRRASMLHSDEAVAHLLARDLEAAVASADAAINAAAPLAGGSGRVLGALRRVRIPLADYTASSSMARDLDARLRQSAPRLLAV